MVFEKVKAIITEKVDVSPEKIMLESSFEDLRIDSLDLVEIIMDIEDTFDITIETNEDMKTVGDLIKYIEENK